MTEPRRFLMDPSASSFERDLLESWSAEQPSPAARTRALALGGLAASGAALLSTSAAAPKALSLAGMAFVKWGALAVLVIGAATATIVSVTSSASAPSAPVAAAPTAPAVVPATVPSPAVAEPAAPPTRDSIAAADLPAVPSAAAPPARTATTTPAAAPAVDSLADEIAAFDGVRAAEASGDADRTLALAAAYERRYPTGAFVQEAEVLRIESLAKKGDRDGAVRVGRQFLAAHPQSPHAGRIRAIVDASNH